MFDSHHHHSHKTDVIVREVTKNVNVTEERAPTDESVRLLDEFQAKAEERIIKSFNIQTNQISGGILVVAPHSASYDSLFKFVVHYRYKLNDKTYQGKGTIDKSVFRGDQMEVVRLLFDDMAKVISNELFEANKECLRNLFV